MQPVSFIVAELNVFTNQYHIVITHSKTLLYLCCSNLPWCSPFHPLPWCSPILPPPLVFPHFTPPLVFPHFTPPLVFPYFTPSPGVPPFHPLPWCSPISPPPLVFPHPNGCKRYNGNANTHGNMLETKTRQWRGNTFLTRREQFHGK